jgi:pimeloyl-ACP methyl ester carboxylesterase
VTTAPRIPTPLLQGEERRIEVPGGTLAARAWGDPAGRPFLALHGWLDNANTFNRLAPLLPELQLLALDFAGHGRSDHRPPGAHYLPLLDVQDVIAAAEALGWKEFGIIGHSMGAGIASETAGLFPERVREAVLIDGMVHHEGGPADGNARNRLAIEQMLAAHGKRPPVYPDLDAMARRVTEATDQSFEAAIELVARGHKEVEGGVTWRTDPRIRFATPVRATARQIDALMAATEARTLLLIARDGDRWYRSGVERRAEHHRFLTVEEMDGPHHVHLEPAWHEEVARRVRAFLGLTAA